MDFIDIVLKAISDIGDWVDIAITAVSDFTGDLYHRWTDIDITATPYGGISVILLAAAGFFLLMLWMEDDWITRRRRK